MAGKKEGGAPWRQTSVVIRADIFEEAGRQNINISEECNRALAQRLGIDYQQQKIPEGNVPKPVIIAPNTIPVSDKIPAKPGVPQTSAIINADDPRAAGAVKSRNLRKERTSPPAPPEAPPRVPANEAVLSIPIPDRPKKTPAPRKKKDDSTKKFFSSVILRDDSDAVVIAKEDMYHTFERWCRDHRVLVIPDKKSFAVTMKNHFAVREKMVKGIPSWIGVRLKG